MKPALEGNGPSKVSSESDELILVDSEDRDIGSLSRLLCHQGDGVLHRAFSLFVFNSNGDLLIQKRASGKMLWGDYWSNSCCSHPRAGEAMEQAVSRRLDEELGLDIKMTLLYKFEYAATFEDKGAEHELCWVYAGLTDREPRTNATEIDSWEWTSLDDLETAIGRHPERFTPWLKLELEQILREHLKTIEQLGCAV